MRRRDTYWSLFQKSEKRQIDDLRTDYIEVVHEVIPVKDHDDWLIWREGFRTWKPLADFPQLLIGLRQAGQLGAASVPAPKPLARAATAETAAQPTKHDETKSEAVTLKPDSVFQPTARKPAARGATTVQDRLNRLGSLDDEVSFGIIHENELVDRDARYPKTWEVRIFSGGGKPIVNQTIDVSNRGMSLRDPVPKGLQRYFNVELVIGDTVLPLMCSEIKTEDGAPSRRIRIEVNHQPNVLQSALLL